MSDAHGQSHTRLGQLAKAPSGGLYLLSSNTSVRSSALFYATLDSLRRYVLTELTRSVLDPLLLQPQLVLRLQLGVDLCAAARLVAVVLSGLQRVRDGVW